MMMRWLRQFRYRLVPEAISLIIGIPIAWQLSDRDLPWYRLAGYIEPTVAGGYAVVHWRTTPLQRICPGNVQVEIISGPLIWPVLSRSTRAGKLGATEYTAPPWPLPENIPPGEATYRVTTFWQCNWTHEFFPLVQVGPDVRFTVLPKAKHE